MNSYVDSEICKQFVALSRSIIGTYGWQFGNLINEGYATDVGRDTVEQRYQTNRVKYINQDYNNEIEAKLFMRNFQSAILK